MKRYWLTGKKAPTASSSVSTLSNGWNTTRLMLAAAENLSKRSADASVILTALVEEVNRLMVLHNIHFVGKTQFPDRYTSFGERVVHGRFGDMRRSGYFDARPPLGVVGIAPLQVRQSVPKKVAAPANLEDMALQALAKHGQLTEHDLCQLLGTRRVGSIMAHLAEALPANALRIEDGAEKGHLYILNRRLLPAEALH